MFNYYRQSNMSIAPVRLWVECHELVNKLKMCRSDLEENIIIAEVQKIASSEPFTIQDILRSCIALAMEGKPMPWEN